MTRTLHICYFDQAESSGEGEGGVLCEMGEKRLVWKRMKSIDVLRWERNFPVVLNQGLLFAGDFNSFGKEKWNGDPGSKPFGAGRNRAVSKGLGEGGQR